MNATTNAPVDHDRVDPARSEVHRTLGGAIAGASDSFPSHAELARTLLDEQRQSVVATLTQTGHPFASRAPFTPLSDGSPIVCISDLAEHTMNIRRDPRASVLVSEAVDDAEDPLARPRVTLVGSFLPFGPTPEQIQTHLQRHPSAAGYVGLDDFSWWRLDVLTARYVGGYGLMGWASGDELRSSSPDPVLPASQPMIDHLNDDHADACRDIVRALAGLDDASSARVTALDRYGITFLSRRPDGVTVARVAFDAVLAGPGDVRAATVRLANRAREQLAPASPPATPATTSPVTTSPATTSPAPTSPATTKDHE